MLLAEHKECTQLLQITQDCLELGGSAGDLMLPVCTLYRVCRTCVSKKLKTVYKNLISNLKLINYGTIRNLNIQNVKKNLFKVLMSYAAKLHCADTSHDACYN